LTGGKQNGRLARHGTVRHGTAWAGLGRGCDKARPYIAIVALLCAACVKVRGRYVAGVNTDRPQGNLLTFHARGNVRECIEWSRGLDCDPELPDALRATQRLVTRIHRSQACMDTKSTFISTQLLRECIRTEWLMIPRCRTLYAWDGTRAAALTARQLVYLVR
jgi:hypothetical protein